MALTDKRIEEIQRRYDRAREAERVGAEPIHMYGGTDVQATFWNHAAEDIGALLREVKRLRTPQSAPR